MSRTYTIDDLRAAFEEGYEVGHDEGRSPCAAGKPMPGGVGAYDPQDPDRIWEESETYRSARSEAAQHLPDGLDLDPYSAATRALSAR